MSKVQFNVRTIMFWSYIPTSVARNLQLKKGDEIDFKKTADGKYIIEKVEKNEVPGTS